MILQKDAENSMNEGNRERRSLNGTGTEKTLILGMREV